MKGFQTVTEPDDPLDLFLPPVRDWFRQTFGTPTVAQQRTWPAIAAGQHTLLLAPTGSGKTLAAFLACLDHLWRHDPLPRGVRVLYVSPLKALNNDIYRNLQVPLQGTDLPGGRRVLGEELLREPRHPQRETAHPERASVLGKGELDASASHVDQQVGTAIEP